MQSELTKACFHIKKIFMKNYLEISTLKCQTKPSLFILHKMQCNFRVAFLLQEGNDRLANQIGASHHVQHFVVAAVNQSQFEAILSRVNCHLNR